jgi:hypothetical protein
MGTRIDDIIDDSDFNMLLDAYEDLQKRDPNHDMLKLVTMDEDRIYAEKAFFDYFSKKDLQTSVTLYFAELKVAAGSWRKNGDYKKREEFW